MAGVHSRAQYCLKKDYVIDEDDMGASQKSLEIKLLTVRYWHIFLFPVDVNY
jgi:hypothetical protein